MLEVTAVGEWILAEEIKLPEKTSGGIIIPEDVKNPMKLKSKKVKILDIGEKIKDVKFKIGDIVFVYYEAGQKIEDFYIAIKESNIMCILNKEEVINQPADLPIAAETLEYKPVTIN